MLKEEQNIANIFYPETKLAKQGYLVGYNFEGFQFVISSVIELSAVQSVDDLHKALHSQKFQAFNHYCASEPIILGVVEEEPLEGEKCPSKEQVTLDFKQEQNIWITIRK